MKRATRLYWLRKFEDEEASRADRLTKQTPVIAEYHNGIPYRWQLLMGNKDVISVNEHGNVCRIDYSCDGSYQVLDNLFCATGCLGSLDRVDKRLANLRDVRRRNEVKVKKRNEDIRKGGV